MIIDQYSILKILLTMYCRIGYIKATQKILIKKKVIIFYYHWILLL